jgi:2-keto-4-pentenoate hydratase/2-oxohepta-3-ene-1,7-dioic acid hydratase in catechol pathway
MDMTTHINGERVQEANTDQMLFSPREVIAFLSTRYTLKPGDVISFGSPANPGGLAPGDDIGIRYEEIGALRNSVIGD